MCSVAMNFSKLAICFIMRIPVRSNTVSIEHATSGATTYSFASTSGGAHGRLEMGVAGGALRSAFGEAADTLVVEVDPTAAFNTFGSGVLSSASRAAFASFAEESLGKSRITAA